MDIKYFINCKILMKSGIYTFYDRAYQTFRCRLPQERFTLLTRANIEFLPETVQLCDILVPALRRR